jgi:hypothetical protein
MKRLSQLLLLAVLLSPLPAHAGSRQVFENLGFRKTGVGRVVDSTFVYAKGSEGSDTTAAYPFNKLPFSRGLDGPKSAATSVVVDSLTWFGFYVGSGGPSAATADTVYVGQQVSIDGVSWVSVTNTEVFLAASTIPPIASSVLLECSSSNQFGKQYQQARSATGALTSSFVNQGATAPTDETLFGWNYIRWVITWSAADAGSAFTCFVSHWSEE